jgi:hypothetical protein
LQAGAPPPPPPPTSRRYLQHRTAVLPCLRLMRAALNGSPVLPRRHLRRRLPRPIAQAECVLDMRQRGTMRKYLVRYVPAVPVAQ